VVESGAADEVVNVVEVRADLLLGAVLEKMITRGASIRRVGAMSSPCEKRFATSTKISGSFRRLSRDAGGVAPAFNQLAETNLRSTSSGLEP
jgi:hypothetical protein